ncbi:MAG: M48 family metalloprotease, partial [Pseudomonadota bacterium]
MSVRPKSLALVLAVLLGALIAALPARAQGLIRDAEIERTLAGIANPIYRAAGLSPSRVSLYLVNDRRLNAFVAGGSNIFMNTGLLQRLESVDEVRAVLAHETGHIAGGHLARRDEQIRRARGTLALGVLASIAAAAAGNPEAAFTAGALGNQVATRNLLAHSRAEESGADQAALAYMVAAGSDPRAIIKVFDLFRGQEILSAGQTDPYIRTHPLWSQRLRDLEAKVDRAPRGRGTDPGLAYWHQRMVAKLDAFLDTPQRTLRDYGNDRSEIGAMARAIAYHRLPDRRRALQAINALLAARSAARKISSACRQPGPPRGKAAWARR